MKKFNDEIKKNHLISVGHYLGLGTQLAGTVIIMFFIGQYLDEKFGTFPYLIIVFSLFGSFAGIYNFIKTVLNINNKSKQNKKQE